MKLLLLGAMLIPMLAHSEICAPDSTSPCMPADFRKSAKPIIDSINQGLAAKSTMGKLRALARNAPTIELRLTYWSQARDSEREMTDSFNRAIQLTQTDYHLAPPTPPDPRAQRPSDTRGAWCANIAAPWSVRFRTSMYRVITGSDGSNHYISDAPEDEHMGGLTDADGAATIFLFALRWSAATNDPGYLAATIYHESLHYQELITSGWTTHEEGEIHAYQATLSIFDSLVMNGTYNDVDVRAQFKKFMEQQIDANTKALQSGPRSPFPDGAQEAANKKNLEEQTAREEEYQALVRLVEKKKQDERDRLAAIQRDIRWQKFRVWTLYACEYIDGVHEGDPEWGNPDLIHARDEGFRSYLHDNLVVMAKDEIEAGLKRDDLYHGGSIGTCQEQVVDMIRDLPGPVDNDWIMNKIEYERNGGRPGEIISRVINAVHDAVRDGSAVIVEIISAPYAADRGSAGGDGRGNDPSGGDRPSRHPDIDKLPWQQLRGISAGGWKD